MTDEEIEKLFVDTNFGTNEYRKILCDGIMKYFLGLHNGWTLECILRKNKFIGVKMGTVTKRGKMLLREQFRIPK